MDSLLLASVSQLSAKIRQAVEKTASKIRYVDASLCDLKHHHHHHHCQDSLQTLTFGL